MRRWRPPSCLRSSLILCTLAHHCPPTLIRLLFTVSPYALSTFESRHRLRIAAPTTPLERYHHLINAGTLHGDDHQTRIIQKLQNLHEQVAKYVPPPVPSSTSPSTKPSFVRSLNSRHLIG